MIKGIKESQDQKPYIQVIKPDIKMQTVELLKCYDLPIGSEDPHSYPKNELDARPVDHMDWIRFTNIAMQTHARFEPAILQEENAQVRVPS
jgi:hypothetical protein